MYSSVLTGGRGTTNTDFYHIDITRIANGKPGTWQWGDGTILDYDRWAPENPRMIDRKKMRLAKYDQLMSDTSGAYDYHYICEITQHIYPSKQRLHILLHLSKG